VSIGDPAQRADGRLGRMRSFIAPLVVS